MDATARYFPFRTGPDRQRLRRSVPPTDRARQRVAARWATIHAVTRALARPLWVVAPVLLVFSVGSRYWLVGVIVASFCVVAVVSLGAVTGRARDEMRLLDELIGIPIPDDAAEAVLATDSAGRRVADLYDDGLDDDRTAELLRPHLPRIRDLDSLRTRTLHEARRHWVDGDMDAWREAVDQLPVVSNMMDQLVDSIIDPEGAPRQSPRRT